MKFSSTVNGGYAEWSDWTQCSESCGDGKQFRTRTCTNPEPQFGGYDCEDVGEAEEEMDCNLRPCPSK